MVFDHRVKFNGVLYNAGENVPMEEEPITPKVEDVAEKVASSSDVPKAEAEKPKRRGGRRKKE